MTKGEKRTDGENELMTLKHESYMGGGQGEEGTVFVTVCVCVLYVDRS